MQKLKKIYAELRENEKKFLMDGKRTIATYNIKTLASMTIVGLILMVIFLAFGFMVPVTVPPDSPKYPSPVHLMFFPVMLIFAVVTNILSRKGKPSYNLVTALCLVFEICCYGFIIAIDIFSHPGTPANFMQIVIVIFSVTIFLSSRLQNILNIIVSAIFIFCALMVNVEDYMVATAKFDIFFMIVGFGFATAVGYHFRLSQINNFTSRMRYKSLSMRDPLLENIYNKRGYEEAINEYLDSKNPNVNCSFIVLDLNDFKHINDNYGHDMGDQILRCMSSTLVSLFRDSDIIGRFGGDEFIVLADGLCDEESVEKKCHYIAELIGKRAQETGAIKVFSSLGAVICEKQNVDFERLFELADEAMYEAKDRGRKADQFVLRRYVESADHTFTKKKPKENDE